MRQSQKGQQSLPAHQGARSVWLLFAEGAIQPEADGDGYALFSAPINAWDWLQHQRQVEPEQYAGQFYVVRYAMDLRTLTYEPEEAR